MNEPTRRQDGPQREPTGGAVARLAITPEQVEAAARALSQMRWGPDGLTREEIRAHYPALPKPIYLRLPSSKRYMSAGQVLHDAEVAPSRAEGEFLGANPNLPEAQSLEDGGPPAWGPTPLFTPGGVVEGGSAEDTEGLEEGE
jgi:hypothetical protein